ncbi:unnamed protein product [Chrysodeixis includens]|uniref:Uncharacterized protein n=1 Tax=Chrysodeixis includens TaxID=689277 RepID=A0A9N8KUW2_CHRIL|nr:unnamed protein product [Chrysodeixis includens]
MRVKAACGKHLAAGKRRPGVARRKSQDVDLTNGQLTPNNNTPLLAQALSVMNNYQAAAAGFGPPASPHGAGGRAGFPAASSPGPALDVYGSAADSVGYVQAASPQPSGFPAIAVSRAPLNYTPVSQTKMWRAEWRRLASSERSLAAAAALRPRTSRPAPRRSQAAHRALPTTPLRQPRRLITPPPPNYPNILSSPSSFPPPPTHTLPPTDPV